MIILSILKHPRRLLVSILTGNTLANVAIASLAAYITQKYAQQHHWNESTLILIEVLIISAIVLIFGEIIPKTYAIAKSEKLEDNSSPVYSAPSRTRPYANLPVPRASSRTEFPGISEKIFVQKSKSFFFHQCISS